MLAVENTDPIDSATAEDLPLRRLLGWDERWYRERYPDVNEACINGFFADGFHHYLCFGRAEGRLPSAAAEQAGLANPPWPREFKLGRFWVPFDWPVKGEPANTFLLKLTNGFFEKYLSGDVILDIGYKGGLSEAAVPILPHATGVDLDYPGYDGLHLPFADASVDTVFASHVLEHIVDYHIVIRDWLRVLRPGGFIVCIVPHQFLYEKRRELPSRWNADHKRFYTPGSLLREFEESLSPNEYRIRHLNDNDRGYLYQIGPEHHAVGSYEIELVVQRMAPPHWTPE